MIVVDFTDITFTEGIVYILAAIGPWIWFYYIWKKNKR